MFHYYYIEIKEYFYSENGCEYQMADGGEPPRVYTSKKKAIISADNIVKNSINNYGNKLILSTNRHPAVKNNCHYAARLFNEKSGIRTEITVTDWYTR